MCRIHVWLLIVDFPRCWQINAYCSEHIIATPAFVVSDSSRLIAALSSVPVVFLAGSLLVADYPASISSARTPPPAISISSSDPKHMVHFPVLDTIYTAVRIQMWTLFHGFTLSVSVSAPLARLPLPINNCQSNSVVFSCRSGWSNLKCRMTKRVDVGKGGVGVQRLRIIQERKTFSRQKTLGQSSHLVITENLYYNIQFYWLFFAHNLINQKS